MGAPKKPSALKAIQGTDTKNKTRLNQNEPVPVRGIGPAHKSLGEYEKEIWDEIVGISYKGVLGEADRLTLEMMCRLTAEMRTDYAEFTAAKLTQLSQLCGRFGMTPSDRTKIVIPKGEKQNPFEDM